MLKKCQQPQGGYVIRQNPRGNLGNRLSIQMREWTDRGATPLTDEELQALAGGAGGEVPLSTAFGVGYGGGHSEATISEALVSRQFQPPGNASTYVGGDLRSLAIGCFYLLMNLTRAIFPHSTRSNPSYRVYIVRTSKPLFRSGDAVLFPLLVEGRKWRRAVVPVLQDGRWSPEVPLNRRRAFTTGNTEYIYLLERALVQSYKAAGFIPEGADV
jgi:hypothetical protein